MVTYMSVTVVEVVESGKFQMQFEAKADRICW